ncbi:MAG: flavodoxin family protein [Candidatus Kapaibacterium sp.]
MKVIAINSSPNMEKGNTALILNPFLDGLREAGAEVNLFYTGNMIIEPCRACTEDTSFESGGICLCNDDMNRLYPHFRDADLWVFASPNYINGITGSLKNVLDRLEPLFTSRIEIDGIDKDNFEPKKDGRVVLVSTCDLWGLDNFDQMIDQIKAISGLFSREFAGALLRPHSGAVNAFSDMPDRVNDIFDSAKKAGKEFPNKRKIDENLQSIVSKTLISKDSFIQEINHFINSRYEGMYFNRGK